MAEKITLNNLIDPVMVVMNSIESIKIQYDGVLDENIMLYFNRIERSMMKIGFMLEELRTEQ